MFSKAEEWSKLTFVARDLVLEGIMQPLNQLCQSSLESRQEGRRLQEKSAIHSAWSMWRSSSKVGSPIGIGAIVVSQIIQVDHQSDLLVVQHPSNRFTVVVICLCLSISHCPERQTVAACERWLSPTSSSRNSTNCRVRSCMRSSARIGPTS